MIIQRYLLFNPFWWIIGQWRNDTGIAHRVAKIHLNKPSAMRFLGNTQTEDSLIHFLPERNMIFDEGKMTHLIEIQQHGIGNIALNRTTFHNRRHRRNVSHIAKQITPF